MEMHPAVRLRSQFNPHAVNIMSQHEHLVMLMVDTCQSGYVACMMTTKKTILKPAFSALLAECQHGKTDPER